MVQKKVIKSKIPMVKKPAVKVVSEEKEVKKTAAKPAVVVKVEKKKVEKSKMTVHSSVQPEVKEAVQPTIPFIHAVGRRKEATARVRMSESGQGQFIINGRELKNYFPNFQLFDLVLVPLKLTGQEGRHDISVKVVGGGKQGQAEAVRHGLSRALVKWQAEFKPPLKKAGYLTRDARVKERKKFGLKKARRAPQWAKR